MWFSIGTVGVLLQNLAYAVLIPIYLVIYVSSSPLISSENSHEYLVDRHVLSAIPLSMVFGYVIPTILMSLPAPSILSFDHKQTFIAIWQMFPMWVAVFQAVIPSLILVFKVDQRLDGKDARKIELTTLRRLYILLMVIAGIGQVSTATLMATSKWFPDLFASQFKGVFDPQAVFVPAAVSPSVKMPSIGAGALLLLQYDQLIGSASMALFATFMYVLARQRISPRHSIGSLFVGGLAVAIVTGPLGYAVACIWARDELIVQADREHGQKSQ